MKSTPILFLSDNPAISTGLGRITKDLAVHVASLPEFRVGTLGRGGSSSSRLPFFNASFDESEQWGERLIEGVWADFAGSQAGIIMTIMDLSRLDWLTRPRMGGPLQEFLTSGKFEVWGYIPVDHYGIGGKLTGLCADAARGFSRMLAYSLFAKGVLEDTLSTTVDWCPHGYNGDVFQPRSRTAGRMMLGVQEDEELIGCVMTNQFRKDFGTAFAAAAKIARPGRKFWFHTDTLIRHWNLLALVQDFNLNSSVILTTSNISSEELSYLYSACNVTMLPSLGEGMGYPLIESMACGVPAIHTNYGGGVEVIPEKDWLVDSPVTRLDGMWNCVRPVLDPVKWAEKVDWVINQYGDGSYKDVCTGAVDHLKWSNLWPAAWKKWFLDGIA